MDHVGARVPHHDLAQPFLNPNATSIRIGRHVAVRQSVQQLRIGECKLVRQVRDTTFVGLDQRPGVMRDQATDHVIHRQHVPQVPRAIQRMESGRSHHRRVPDVVQPRGRLNDSRPLPQHAPQLVGSLPHPLRVSPPSRQLIPKQPLRHSLRFLNINHHPTVRRRPGQHDRTIGNLRHPNVGLSSSDSASVRIVSNLVQTSVVFARSRVAGFEPSPCLIAGESYLSAAARCRQYHRSHHLPSLARSRATPLS